MLENRGAFQGTPSDKRWQGHRGLHYEKIPPGHHLSGQWLFRFGDRSWGAGNDCDALRSAMEQGQDALGNP